MLESNTSNLTWLTWLTWLAKFGTVDTFEGFYYEKAMTSTLNWRQSTYQRGNTQSAEYQTVKQTQSTNMAGVESKSWEGRHMKRHVSEARDDVGADFRPSQHLGCQPSLLILVTVWSNPTFYVIAISSKHFSILESERLSSIHQHWGKPLFELCWFYIVIAQIAIPHICHRHHRRCLCKKNCPV